MEPLFIKFRDYIINIASISYINVYDGAVYIHLDNEVSLRIESPDTLPMAVLEDLWETMTQPDEEEELSET